MRVLKTHENCLTKVWKVLFHTMHPRRGGANSITKRVPFQLSDHYPLNVDQFLTQETKTTGFSANIDEKTIFTENVQPMHDGWCWPICGVVQMDFRKFTISDRMYLFSEGVYTPRNVFFGEISHSRCGLKKIIKKYFLSPEISLLRVGDISENSWILAPAAKP